MENRYLREPRHARVVVFPTQKIILPEPREEMRNFASSYSKRHPVSDLAVHSGPLTWPYYKVFYQLKNRGVPLTARFSYPLFLAGL